ncbi:putative membrane protein [Mesorhizobium australicum WSM2073]|uniref:Putative membrane protein n=1 Tax=Mesorhizobium australicum (strain HAMBI 3006 / LMG 24608 / WSM2073) TaxID=754035 RepID=L0KSX1_MESAW|nr:MULTISPECIES: GtrA family protein [Mesorhizobium]AGB48211.1 putative membrane protein [Mesorhizobium australicum WSM2073]TPK80447.1 GtrA family protein [Mesorhizobium sp. B2-4-18]
MGRIWSTVPAGFSRMLRFGAVGLLNTALGYCLILAGLKLGLGDIAANMTGYAGGLVLGFFLNRRWTFGRAGGFRSGTAVRYALAFVVAYTANLTIVVAAMSAGVVENPFVHLAGNCLYSVLFYLGSVRFVFVGAAKDAVLVAIDMKSPGAAT